MRDITEIILHCSATWSKSDIGVAEITQWHTMPKSKGGRGWDHVGYHYVIRRNGIVENGCPITVSGYHCSYHNAHSIGICMVGGGPMGEDNNFTTAQFDALAMLIRQLRKSYPLASIHGHNEYAQKACPVFSVRDFLAKYQITKTPWDSARWPHFKPSEFTELWGNSDMPQVWTRTLDALEALRTAYGKPIVLLRTEYIKDVPVLIVDCKIPASRQKDFIRLSVDKGFVSARAVDGGVRIYMELSA